MQLIVHTPDGGEEFRPAYTVTVAGRRVFVRPLREGWAESARRIEDGINRSRSQRREAAQVGVPVETH
jgi:hypothetical protein